MSCDRPSEGLAPVMQRVFNDIDLFIGNQTGRGPKGGGDGGGGGGGGGCGGGSGGECGGGKGGKDSAPAPEESPQQLNFEPDIYPKRK